MCVKCKLAMSNPKELMQDHERIMGLVEAVMPALANVQRQVIANGMMQGLDINPITVAASFGWVYYAMMYVSAFDGDMTVEEFEKFNASMMADVRKGCEQVAESMKMTPEFTALIKSILREGMH